MKNIVTYSIGFTYRYFLRPIIFLSPSEIVHERMTDMGERMGKSNIFRRIFSILLNTVHPSLSQEVVGIQFDKPLGLSAGFDYQAKLTQVIPALDFGFGTVGTITNKPYGGNPPPLLGRLVKSRSLMVNKGFKNAGMKALLQKLEGYSFSIPIGLSIGQTNTNTFKTCEDAIKDIVASFKQAEKSTVPFSYYELNISCPNLHSAIEFYSPGNLRQLLSAVSARNLKKPLFIKMPITQSDAEVKKMLAVIVSFPVAGVIFGNLQKNRQDPSLNPSEVAKFSNGNFSGKPTEKRSNELIRLTYKKYGEKLVIIGCGGVFSAEDAYKKVKLGATLVQYITGLIFEGPQLTTQIHTGLEILLRQDGFTHISQAIGIEA